MGQNQGARASLLTTLLFAVGTTDLEKSARSFVCPDFLAQDKFSLEKRTQRKFQNLSEVTCSSLYSVFCKYLSLSVLNKNQRLPCSDSCDEILSGVTRFYVIANLRKH